MTNTYNIEQINLKINECINNNSCVLDLSDLDILDLSYINIPTHITHLSLSNNRISNITPLKKLVNLTNLELNDNNITELKDISSLNLLVFLNLSNNAINKLTPLKKLDNLTYLYLSHTEISDNRTLKSLSKLNYLSVSCSKVSNLIDFKKLIGVEFNLELNYTGELDINTIKELDCLLPSRTDVKLARSVLNRLNINYVNNCVEQTIFYKIDNLIKLYFCVK